MRRCLGQRSCPKHRLLTSTGGTPKNPGSFTVTMTIQTIFTIVLLIATLAVMSSQKVRTDLVALVVMLLLVLSGIVPAGQAFAAFGQPVMIIVAGIYIIGAALLETGVATMLANQIQRVGAKGETTLLLMLMLLAALLTSVLSGMLVVALLMPAALRIARQINLAPSRLLLPLATIASIGSQLTLIGTPSNLVVSDILADNTGSPLGLFSVTGLGLASVAVAMVWFLLPGRRFLKSTLPDEPQLPSLDEVQHSYKLDKLLYRLRVRSGSNLIGEQLLASDLSLKFGLNLIAVRSQDGKLRPAKSKWVLEQDDLLIVTGDYGHVLQAANRHLLELKGAVHLSEFNQMEQETLRLAEVIVPIRSALIGKTLAQVDFRGRYGLNILAVQRQSKVIRQNLPALTLAASDTLLVQGPLDHIRAVGKDLNLLVMTNLAPRPGDLITSKASLTLAILAAMLLAVVTGLAALDVASFTAAMALIITGCISLNRAYHSIDVKVIMLIGGMLPLALALENTGAAEVVANLIIALSQNIGVIGSLVIAYLLAAVITQVISNSVVAALMTPIAIKLALVQGAPPEPFALAIIFAANAAWVTPLTDGNNLLVREPGVYTMRDYLTHGLPIFALQSAAVLGLLAYFWL